MLLLLLLLIPLRRHSCRRDVVVVCACGGLCASCSTSGRATKELRVHVLRKASGTIHGVTSSKARRGSRRRDIARGGGGDQRLC